MRGHGAALSTLRCKAAAAGGRPIGVDRGGGAADCTATHGGTDRAGAASRHRAVCVLHRAPAADESPAVRACAVGRDAEVTDRAIDVQVARLRKAIEDDPGNPLWIKTVWGAGYVFSGGQA